MATIQEVYIALFGRPADPIGYNYYVEATDDGANLDAVGDLSNSPEYLDRFDGMNNVQKVNAIYEDLFGRPADAAGLIFYTNLLDTGAATEQDIAIRILDGAEGTDDQPLIDAKVAAAQAFTDSLDEGDEIVAYQGEAGIEFGQKFLAQIESADDELTQEEIDAQIETFVTTGAVPGEDPDAPSNQINFTAAIGEQVVGTDANDAITGVLDGGVTAGDTGTVNVGDTVNGGAGVDTLNLLVVDSAAGAGVLPAGFTSTDVEIVNITYADGGSLGALNSGSFGGVEQLWQVDNTNANDDFQNVTVAADVTAGFRSTGVAATAAAVAAATTVTAASGSQDAIGVAFDGVDSGSGITLVGAGLETATVSGDVAGAGALTVNGAASIETLNLGLTSNGVVTLATFAGVDALDLSESTGNLTVDVTGLTALETVTGGSGNDTITLDLENGEEVTVDAGAGNDFVDLNAGGTAAAANNASTITLGAGRDTVSITDVSNIFDADEADFADGIITVADFDASADVLDLNTASTTLTGTQLANIAAEENLFDAITAASAIAASDTVAFNYDGNVYVYVDNNSDDTFDSGDGLVEVTGLQVEEFTGTNFVA